MAYCIDCKKELSKSEIEDCDKAETNGLYCTSHLKILLQKTIHTEINRTQTTTSKITIDDIIDTYNCLISGRTTLPGMSLEEAFSYDAMQSIKQEHEWLKGLKRAVDRNPEKVEPLKAFKEY